MIKALLFDIDGTLLDTREFIIQAYLHTIRKHRGITFERETLLSFVNGTIHEVYERALPGYEKQPLVDTHEEFQTANLDLISVYDDVHVSMELLRNFGIKFAAITNRRRKSAHTNLQLHDLDIYFDHVITPEDVVHTKPDPEGILKALKRFGVKKAEALMVGDAATDVKAGQNAGVKTVGVTHGFSTHAQLIEAGADHIIDSISELVTLCEESESN